MMLTLEDLYRATGVTIIPVGPQSVVYFMAKSTDVGEKIGFAGVVNIEGQPPQPFNVIVPLTK